MPALEMDRLLPEKDMGIDGVVTENETTLTIGMDETFD